MKTSVLVACFCRQVYTVKKCNPMVMRVGGRRSGPERGARLPPPSHTCIANRSLAPRASRLAVSLWGQGVI
jgi:hypothetical protein